MEIRRLDPDVCLRDELADGRATHERNPNGLAGGNPSRHADEQRDVEIGNRPRGGGLLHRGNGNDADDRGGDGGEIQHGGNAPDERRNNHGPRGDFYASVRRRGGGRHAERRKCAGSPRRPILRGRRDGERSHRLSLSWTATGGGSTCRHRQHDCLEIGRNGRGDFERLGGQQQDPDRGAGSGREVLAQDNPVRQSRRQAGGDGQADPAGCFHVAERRRPRG